MSNARTILGILAASAVGVAIGMLLAPQKGSELQKSIKDSIEDLGSQVGDLISEGKEKLIGAEHEAKSQATGIKKEIKTDAEQIKSSLS